MWTVRLLPSYDLEERKLHFLWLPAGGKCFRLFGYAVDALFWPYESVNVKVKSLGLFAIVTGSKGVFCNSVRVLTNFCFNFKISKKACFRAWQNRKSLFVYMQSSLNMDF